MLVLEAKLKGKTEKYNLIDEAIRTALFCRNKSLRYGIDKVLPIAKLAMPALKLVILLGVSESGDRIA